MPFANENEVRNRLGFHAGNEVTIPKHQIVRTAFIALMQMLDGVLPDGRAKSVAFTKLEEAGMWSNKAVAELAPVTEPVDMTDRGL